MAIAHPNGKRAAPETPEQVLAKTASGHDMGGGARSARGHGYELRGLGYVPASRSYEGRFGRVFRLPPFTPSDKRILEIAERMVEGESGRDPAFDNPDIPAGFTYLGQFIDHDLTFDTASSLERQNDPDALTNFRTPRFDLDSMYGRGPADDPFLYSKASGRQKLLIGHHDDEDDLPRNSEDTALIGDPRNDENIFVSQFHLTMLKFHNSVLDMVEGDPSLQFLEESAFDTAQRLVRWHYQWMVIHDYLRRTVGQEMLDSVLDTSGWVPRVDRRYFRWKYFPFMPVEFSVAAYRFGHSQIRGGYKLNTLVGPLPTFKPGSVETDPLGHFGGFRILPPFWTTEWARFFEVDGAGKDERQMTRLIDTRLADPLKDLPVEIGGSRPSLVERNLMRGSRLMLPSGQEVAKLMGADVLSDADLDLPKGGLAPLWYYILREAEVQAGGRHLGQVGGRIVAEVFLGLMEADPLSYLHQQPNWTPMLPSSNPGDFTCADLITLAGHGLEVTNLPGRPAPSR